MGKLTVFNFVTLNGFFQGEDGDVQWAHESPSTDYAVEMLEARGTLLFGRVTYEQMASFWPTPMAAEMMPELAKGMNAAPKIVVSRTLKKAEWSGATILSGAMEEQVAKLKAEGRSMTILGSGQVTTQLAARGLIDEYELMVHPIVLEAGTPFLHGLRAPLRLELLAERRFASGTVLLRYRPRR